MSEKKSLAMAYAVKKKMAPQFKSKVDSKKILEGVMRKRMSKGGLVEDETDSDDMFLEMPDDNDELDSPLPNEDELDPKKELLKRIMDKHKAK